MPMTREERRDRRAKIAEYAKTHSTNQAVSKFGVSKMTVVASCKEFGVSKQQAINSYPSTYVVVAGLISGKKASEIAADLNVSPQFVSQCKKKMREHGVFKAVEEYANSK